jgi:hypothetical protein
MSTGWPCLNAQGVDDMKRSEAEVIDGSNSRRQAEIVMEDLPPCKDPELQKWLFRMIKESNAELQLHIETRMEQLLEPLLKQGRVGKPVKPPPKGATSSEEPPPPEHHHHHHEAAAAAPAIEATEVQVSIEDATKEAAQTVQGQPVVEEAAAKSPDKGAGPMVGTMTSTVPKRHIGPHWLWQQRGMQVGKGSTMEVLPHADLTGIDRFMHTPLDITAGLLIALNTLVSFIHLDYKGYLINVDYGSVLDSPQNVGGWPGAEKAFEFLEYLFASFFLCELILRLWYFRCTFFLDKLNILDGGVVMVTSVDTFILANVLDGQGSANLGFIRIIRYCKLVRTLRFVRAMQLCSPLRVLIRTILSSFASLFWSMVILGAFMLMSALFLCQTLQDYIRDQTQDIEQRRWVNQHYGSATKAVWTMFEITFSGGWPGFTRRIIEHVSPWYSIFFFLYVGGVVFAVIRIITALFLKDTLAVAANDQEMMMQQKAKDKDKFARKLREVFEEADESGDGTVCWEEFQGMLNNPKAKASLSAMELESHEVESLFQLLDDGDGTVSFDEFLKGVVRLKGQARSQDVLAILHDSRKVLNHVMSMEKKLQMLDLIEEELDEYFPEGSALLAGSGSSMLQDTAEPEDTNAAAVM